MKVVSIATVSMLWCASFLHLSSQSPAYAANSHSQTGSPQAADSNLDRLQKETAARPDWIEGWWNLGTAAYDANRFELAVSSLTRVLQAQPQMGIGWDLLGLSQFELKRYSDARASLEHGYALGSIDDPEVEAVAAYHLGMLRIRDADFQGGQAVLLKNFGASPNPQAQLALGLAAMRVALLPTAIDPSREALLLQVGSATASGDKGLEIFANLVAANNSVPMLHLAFGEALQSAGRSDGAIKQFQRETELSPQSPAAWKALSLAERKSGHIREADAAAANASKFEKGEVASEERSRKWFAAQSTAVSETALADGMRAYASGQFALSATQLSAWVASHPGDGTAWAVLGLSEYKLENYSNARVHLERGISLGLQADAQAVATARYTLGMLLLRESDFDRAATELDAARKLGGPQTEIEQALGCALLHRTELPTDADKSLAIKAGKIEVMLLESRYDEAFPAFRTLLTQYPQQPNLHWAFGTALLALSEYDEAVEQMRAELKLSPNSSLPYSGLASAALRQHRPSDAVESAQHAVSLSPNAAEAHYLLGRALLESGGSIPKAIEELQRASQLNPNSPEVHFSLAKAYSRDSKPEEAAREREVFNHLNELRQTQTSGDANQIYAGPRQADIFSDSPAKQGHNP